MNKFSITAAISFLSVTIAFSQVSNLKEQALDQFRKEHYDESIALLERALIESPDDPEIYFYLGWFNHYRAYDSRPLKGYNYSYSEQIFKYLEKALELNPDYGDAKYFYGAECSGNAFLAMQYYDSEKLMYFYERAYLKGAYPDWLIEFGKNFLMQCDENAILFTGGNMDFDICSYLQLIENMRTDVTVIPIGNIDRPWYVLFIKNGLNQSVRKINMNLTEQQIMEIHPFKWKETDVFIKISPADRINLKLPEDYQMKWTVYPDLTSERMHSKIQGEEEFKRTYLSPQRAILLQIIEDNFADRPIFFSNFASPVLYGGLEEYFQNCGLISKLVPKKTVDTDYAFDVIKLQTLTNSENFKSYKGLKENDFPRISGVVMTGYGQAFFNLAGIYSKSEEKEKLDKLKEVYKAELEIGLDPKYEQMVLEGFE